MVHLNVFGAIVTSVVSWGNSSKIDSVANVVDFLNGIAIIIPTGTGKTGDTVAIINSDGIVYSSTNAIKGSGLGWSNRSTGVIASASTIRIGVPFAVVARLSDGWESDALAGPAGIKGGWFFAANPFARTIGVVCVRF